MRGEGDACRLVALPQGEEIEVLEGDACRLVALPQGEEIQVLEGDACRLVALPQGGHQTSHRAAYACIKETRADVMRCKEGWGWCAGTSSACRQHRPLHDRGCP